MKNLKGTLILLLTAMIWGIAFVAQDAAAGNIGSFTFNGTRAVLAAVFLLVVIIVKDGSKKQKIIPEKTEAKKILKAGIICGVFLSIAVNLQQLGIAAYPDGVAVSGRSGFLTATYVVMVAVVSLFFGKKLNVSLVVAVVGCMAGLYLLCLSGGLSGIYTGDILIFCCAIAFTCHIIAADRFSSLDTVKVSFIQFVVVSVLSFIPAVIFEKIEWQSLVSAWLPIVYAGVCSSGIGYTLQMIGQKYAEPAVASIVTSFESVFAALAGWVILGQSLSGKELLGCALMFVAIIAAQIPDVISEVKKRKSVDINKEPRFPN